MLDCCFFIVARRKEPCVWQHYSRLLILIATHRQEPLLATFGLLFFIVVERKGAIGHRGSNYTVLLLGITAVQCSVL